MNNVLTRYCEMPRTVTEPTGCTGFGIETANDRLDGAKNDADALLQRAADCMPIGLVMFDANYELQVANTTFCELYGLDQTLVVPGLHLRDLIRIRQRESGSSTEEIETKAQEVSDLVERRQPHVRVDVLSDGRHISVSHRPLPCGGWVGTHEDVTERIRVQEQLRYLATHDPLTGAKNRAFFWERLDEAAERRRRDLEEFAVHIVDLDRFKDINDTYGHEAGDTVLKEVTRRLQAMTRSVDVVARLGGDEFAIIQSCRNLGQREARRLAERIVSGLSDDIEIMDRHVNVGASVGASMSDAIAIDVKEMVREADAALYAVKRNGRGGFEFFSNLA